MRHLLLALMVVLLPLRGWMGDAMATDMAINITASLANTTKTIAAGAHKTSASSHFEHQSAVPASATVAAAVVQAPPDCAGHAFSGQAAVAEAHDGHDGQTSQEDHCKPCQSCQACHSVALSASLPAVSGVFAAPVVLHAVAAEFTSALAALGQKPPIS